MVEHVRVAIAGAGFSGLGAAIGLVRAGVEDYLVLERADEIGGTWRDNTYPGCSCDVPSHLYSYSFAPNPGWSRAFSPQREIQRYLRDCAERFGVLPRVRLRTELLDAQWDATALRWRIATSAGPLTADVLVAACGPFCEPVVPRLPGLDSFAGAAFHSARWDHGYDLTGKRVAVIGTGASAVQIVPAIAERVAHLDVYQRTAPWVAPRQDRAIPAWRRRAFRRYPVLQRALRAVEYAEREAFLPPFRSVRVARFAQRIVRRHLHAAVADPALRARLTPEYALGCKRILLSSDYLPALCRPDVELVTDEIAEVRPGSLVTRDGTERPVDAIVFGTGFRVTDIPVAERIRDQHGRTLAEHWQGSPRAYLGVQVAGLPNLFLLLGPNSGLGHTSVIIMVEAQIRYLLRALRFLRHRGLAALAPRAEAEQAFVAEVDDAMRGTVWTAGGCRSWYLDPTGRNSTLWPHSTWAYRRRLRRFRPEHHDLLVSTPEEVSL